MIVCTKSKSLEMKGIWKPRSVLQTSTPDGERQRVKEERFAADSAILFFETSRRGPRTTTVLHRECYEMCPKRPRRGSSSDDAACNARWGYLAAAPCTDIPDIERPAVSRRTPPSRGDASCSSSDNPCRRNDSGTCAAARGARPTCRRRWGRGAAVAPRTNPEIRPRGWKRRGRRCYRRRSCR